MKWTYVLLFLFLSAPATPQPPETPCVIPAPPTPQGEDPRQLFAPFEGHSHRWKVEAISGPPAWELSQLDAKRGFQSYRAVSSSLGSDSRLWSDRHVKIDGAAIVSFWYRSTLRRARVVVEFSTDGGSRWFPARHRPLKSSRFWRTATIPLPREVVSRPLVVGFRFRQGPRFSRGDFFLDDVCLTRDLSLPGPPDPPGNLLSDGFESGDLAKWFREITQ